VPWHCSEWATAADRRHVYFRIDPEATYSDGVQISRRTFFFTFFVIAQSSHSGSVVQRLLQKGIQVGHDLRRRPHHLLRNCRSRGPNPLWVVYDFLRCRVISFKEFGADFPARYQWRKSPTTERLRDLP
jgi:microcin C transport system substrate-binding protein